MLLAIATHFTLFSLPKVKELDLHIQGLFNFNYSHMKPNQDPQDIIHVTDLFTTACRIAGIIDKIPNDRVTDGLDQTSLLLNGEGYGRRNYIFHYSGRILKNLSL
jgi:hypothetical protein